MLVWLARPPKVGAPPPEPEPKTGPPDKSPNDGTFVWLAMLPKVGAPPPEPKTVPLPPPNDDPVPNVGALEALLEPNAGGDPNTGAAPKATELPNAGAKNNSN